MSNVKPHPLECEDRPNQGVTFKDCRSIPNPVDILEMALLRIAQAKVDVDGETLGIAMSRTAQKALDDYRKAKSGE